MTNKFDSDFDRIEKAFRKQDAIEPNVDAKREAMEQAFAAFGFEEEKKEEAPQEIVREPRLKDQEAAKKPFFDWRDMMKTLNSRYTYSLLGGASVAVLALVAIGPELMRELNWPQSQRQQPAEERVKAETATRQDVQVRQPSKQTVNDAGTTAREAPSEPLIIERPAPMPELDEAVSELTSGQEAAPAVKKSVAPTATFQQSFKAERANGRIAQQEGLVRMAPLPEPNLPTYGQSSNDRFEAFDQNSIKSVREEPVSTFSADVDTASYSFLRSSLKNNIMPPADSVRIEELVNYFDYDYATPTNSSEPFEANVEIMPTPWNEGTKLLSIGIKGYDLAPAEQPDSNLVFLIDTSGSMNQPDKLPLLRSSFKLLLDSLKPTDTVSIVTYAGSAGTVLEPTRASERSKILSALDRLGAGGSTAGAAGIRQAYALAQENQREEGVNRVILATDGDFNVGISDPEQLETYIAKKRKSGIGLSVLGFGRGNYNDHLMQALAQNGNGNASYIDTLSEARKVLVDEAGSTLFTIAKDVKLQVEFNPELVSEYRLIGYETRALNREDFNDDKVDAGELGAGHTVTALYEITPSGSSTAALDPLRYGTQDDDRSEALNPNEYGFLKIRYKLPDEDRSKLISRPLTVEDEVASVGAASQDMRFAASVAGFGELLKGGRYTKAYTYDQIIALAQAAKGEDRFGYRSEFINLVRLADSIDRLQ